MTEFNATSATPQQLSKLLESHGLTHYGWAPISQPLSLSFYKTWLADGHHGSMEYLARHLPQKENPESLLPQARSAIVIACNYIPHPAPLDTPVATDLRVAFYARGADYHDWLKDKLLRVIDDLKKIYPNDAFLPATDSSPILERDLAYRAGLGWVGKNTCLIDQKRGSFFLISEILTSLDLTSHVQALHPDRCGTCTRCIDACPTQALIEPKKLDARKCISYLTIESKIVPEPALRAKIGDNFFGCDICQTVCPWNEKAFGPTVKTEQAPILQVKDEAVQQLRFILTSSNKDLERHFKNSPLSRARGFGLKRNALIVAANQQLRELESDIRELTTDPRLGELAQWALNTLKN